MIASHRGRQGTDQDLPEPTLSPNRPNLLISKSVRIQVGLRLADANAETVLFLVTEDPLRHHTCLVTVTEF
jgi:hypothetical protein